MKNKILLLLIIFSTQVNAQINSNWKKIIIEPDLLVYLPEMPKVSVDSIKTTYEVTINKVIFRVTSEKSPLNYYGRTIKEVDDEYYNTLTKRILTKNQKLLKERNFLFEGHNVRELIYSDSINSMPCTVTLQILNVTGFDEAMYKFYFIDFKNRSNIPKEYLNFFSDWDLYYKLENEMKNSENEDKVLEEKGFVVEKKVIIVLTIIFIFITIFIYNKNKNASSK